MKNKLQKVIQNKKKYITYLAVTAVTAGVLVSLYKSAGGFKFSQFMENEKWESIIEASPNVTGKETCIPMGENILYAFAPEGKLYICGTGATKSFATPEEAQTYLLDELYQEYYGEESIEGISPADLLGVLDGVKEIIVEEGITTFGTGSLSVFYYAEQVSLPETITSMDKWSYAGLGQYAEQTEWIGLELFSTGMVENVYLWEEQGSAIRLGNYVSGGRSLEASGKPIKELPEQVVLEEAELLEVIPMGESVEYRLYQDGTLLVTGTGETFRYETLNELQEYLKEELHCISQTELNTRWFEQVTGIIIEEGVTAIGAHALSGYRNVEEITVYACLKQIEQRAFLGAGLRNKKDIVWNADLSSAICHEDAFAACKNNPLE